VEVGGRRADRAVRLDQDLGALLAQAIDDLVVHPGVRRIGVARRHLEPLAGVQRRPAVGQGGLAELTRYDHHRAIDHVLDHPPGGRIAAVRADLAKSGGRCLERRHGGADAPCRQDRQDQPRGRRPAEMELVLGRERRGPDDGPHR